GDVRGGREPAHLRAGRSQQAKLRHDLRRGAHQDHRTGGQIEKDREKMHRGASPARNKNYLPSKTLKLLVNSKIFYQKASRFWKIACAARRKAKWFFSAATIAAASARFIGSLFGEIRENLGALRKLVGTA